MTRTYGYVGDEPGPDVEEPMSSLKRYRQLGGGEFYKFSEQGQALEGIWRGTQTGKFGENGVIETPDGQRHMFSLNTALKDLVGVQPGVGVKVVYLGKQTAKNGNEFKAYQVFVEEDAQVDSDEAPF